MPNTYQHRYQDRISQSPNFLLIIKNLIFLNQFKDFVFNNAYKGWNNGLINSNVYLEFKQTWFELCPSPEKFVNYMRIYDVIFQMERIACIPSISKFMKRLRDMQDKLKIMFVPYVLNHNTFMTPVLMISFKNLICRIIQHQSIA